MVKGLHLAGSEHISIKLLIISYIFRHSNYLVPQKNNTDITSALQVRHKDVVFDCLAWVEMSLRVALSSSCAAW